MSLSPKTILSRMGLLRPLMETVSLETVRNCQNKLGELMENRFRRELLDKEHTFEGFTAAWLLPRDTRREGVVLYLHGGGYVCGGLEYARAFGAMVASRCGVRVLAPAYRLAPEHPFPAALDDAVESYRYLLFKGYAPEHITLCGESAGGGLCYSLCLRLKELDLPLPGGIVAISPWTDLTASGESYENNKEIDPSMTAEQLDFYADCYTVNRKDPLVSPLFADLTGMPPSQIFVGGDEIMLSDASLLHEKLVSTGCRSNLTVKPERWHGYLLYSLTEDQSDFGIINRFLNQVMSMEGKIRWMRLDNAAKIYPAARRQNWSNVFRLSATLTEEVDRAVLQSALDVTVRRFPSIGARLRRGVFWYYLEQLTHAPQIKDECSYPLTRMDRDEVRQCAFRVIVYKKRIAVEIFHSLTDGNGALVFLKSLLAEYLQQKHGLAIPAEKGVLGRLEEPSPAEMEDSFLKYAGHIAASRRESDAWQLYGTPEPDGFLHVTCLQIPVKQALEKAHLYDVSLTAFLGAAMMLAIQRLQAEKVPFIWMRKPVKVLLPVNLRRLFPSRTLRNFVLYTTPEIDPRLGQYTFEEICRAVKHKMCLEIEPKIMSSKIATNVGSEKLMAVRVMPLFIKNFVMKMVFNSVGEKKNCLSLSNLGAVELPEAMKPYVRRLDFILGTQATAPYNCGVLSYGDTLYINLIRNIREPELEQHFYRVLRDLGLSVQAESNGPRH